MPREEMQFCGRRSHLLAPQARKRARVGERLGVETVDYGRACTVCVDRHGLALVSEAVSVPAEAESPAVAAAPVVKTPAPPAPWRDLRQDKAVQRALVEMPAWMVEDGRQHGRERLETAADELHRKPAPAAKDAKDIDREERPVRRPAKPRREVPTGRKTADRQARLDELQRLLAAGTPREEAVAAAGYASLASARVAVRQSGRDDLRRMLRTEHPEQSSDPEQKDAPQVARQWAEQMPGPNLVHRPTVAEKYGVPAPAPVSAQEVARRNRALATAYARRHGRDMAPPTRRGIVSAAEIMADVSAGTANLPGDVELLGIQGAADYLGVSPTTLKRWAIYRELPSERRNTGTGMGMTVYRASDLNALAAAVEAEKEQKADASAAATAAKPAAPSRSREDYAQARRESTNARLDAIARAMDGGVGPKEAATAAGYKDLASPRRAAERMGREDLAAKLTLRPDLSAALRGRAA